MSATEKDKAIATALKSLNGKYGTNTIIKLDDTEMKIEAISTGSLALDYVFACGGLPRGRIIEMFGPESGGKSTLALFIAAEVQRQGGKVAWVDAEMCFDSDYATKLGIKVKDIFMSQPENGEQALDIVDKMASTAAIDLIVLDSVAALVPAKELAGEFKDAEMAQTARMLAKGMRMLAGNISKTNTVVIFINQLREILNVQWGPKTRTPGGKALKFFASVRLEVRKGKIIKHGEEAVGNEMIIKAIKNKVGMPFRTASLNLYYGKGIDLNAELFDLGVKTDVIKKEGISYFFGEEKIGVGKETSIEYIGAHPEVAKKMRKILKETNLSPYDLPNKQEIPTDQEEEE